jgi:hypothetical protein
MNSNLSRLILVGGVSALLGAGFMLLCLGRYDLRPGAQFGAYKLDRWTGRVWVSGSNGWEELR